MIIDGNSSRGMSVAIARHARMLIAQEEQAFRPASLERKARWDLLERFAQYAERVGDDDLGVLILWRAQLIGGAGTGGYSPGQKQAGAFETVGAALGTGEQNMLPEMVMTRLVIAALEDISGNVQRTIAQATTNAERHQARYTAGLEEQVAQLSQAHREALTEIDQIQAANRSEVGLLRSYYARYQALISGDDVGYDDDEQIRDGVALPGFERVQVRAGRDGKLTFQARWPDPARAGASKKKSGFATPQEAQAYADSMIAGHDAREARADVERVRDEREQTAREHTEKILSVVESNPTMSIEAAALSMDVSTIGPVAAQRNAEQLNQRRVEQLVADGMDRDAAVYSVTGERALTPTQLAEIETRDKLAAGRQ